MGIGDNLLALGEARKLHKKTGKKVIIVARDGRPVKSEVFDHVPFLAQRIEGVASDYVRLLNAPGMRPYIASKTPQQWTWWAYAPHPATVVLTPEEMEFAEPYRGMVMLEPNVKAIGHRNKDWGAIPWSQLDSAIHLDRVAEVVQCGPPGTRWLNHARRVETPTFRHAMAVLSVCRAFVGAEGGLHHAAAAVGTSAVVIFGGFISPEVTGYKAHRNLFTGTGLGCGMRVDCDHCRAAMGEITAARVLAELKEIL
jgi:ADP-heptose:LPS heptosyltransferase